MANVNWKEVETLIDEVLELPREEQIHFIHKRCGNSVKLKSEVTRLLQSIYDSEGWLDSAQALKANLLDQPGIISKAAASAGEKIGPYRIINLIGHGGMGSIFLAERDDGTYKQTVALKLIRREMATPSNKARFKRERQILAGLSHPNIASLYDGGVTSDGLPYLVMEYVDGKAITNFCDDKRLTIEKRIDLFKQVCGAVQYAHNNLIIHRDLKPDNILVTDEGQVKVLDFGIAKLIDTNTDSDFEQIQTIEGSRILTLRYAAPEQINNTNLTTATDIYALGILMYQLSAGVHPFELKGKKISEIESFIREKDPLSPGMRFSELPPELQIELAAKQSVRPAEVIRSLNNDFAAILLKTLRKEPEARYDSAGKFLEDLDRYNLNLPVEAREGTVQYHLGKFIKRHRTWISAAAIFLLMITGFVSFYTWQITTERNFARMETEKAEAVKDFLVTMITASNPWISPGETPTARDLISQGALAVEEDLQDKPALAAEISGVIGASYQGMREDELAKQYLSRSMQLINDGADLEPLTIAGIQAKYAGALLRSGQPREAEELAEQALDRLTTENGENIRAELMSMLANAQSLLGKPDEAVSSSEAGANLVCNSSAEFIPQCLNALMELKNLQEWAGDYKAGLEAAETAYQIADSTVNGLSNPMRMAVAGTYGNALSLNARSEEAIPLLGQNAEFAKELYGENSYRYARALYDLSSAYQFAGRMHDALPSAEQVFEIGGTRQAGNPMNSYWLYRIFKIALDLRMPERAESAYEKYAYALPDRMSSYYTDAFEVEHLRLQALTEPGNLSTQEQVLTLLEKLRENGSALIPDAALLATEQALEAGNITAAADLLDIYHSTIGDIADSDIRPAKAMLLNARVFTMQNELGQAMNEGRRSLEMLKEAGHHGSPFVAEARAVLAGLHCRQNEPAEGIELLESSKQYWREIAGVPAGLSAMEKLAPGCSNL